MCRLLGYATANVNVSLDEVLGMRECAAFRDLSEIHNDGWGAVLINEPGHAAHVNDGGAPSPETGSALYRNTIAAQYDPIFNELAHAPALTVNDYVQITGIRHRECQCEPRRGAWHARVRRVP